MRRPCGGNKQGGSSSAVASAHSFLQKPRSFTLSPWPICSVDRRKPPAVKGPYLSPGDGGTGNMEQVGCIRQRQSAVVSQREERSESLCAPECLPASQPGR